VALLGTVALVVDVWLLPAVPASRAVPLRQQLSLLRDGRVMLALLITALGFGGQIVAYTYVASFLERISGFASNSVPLLLFVFGIAAAIGTFAAGPPTDRWPRATLVVGLAVLAVVLGAMAWTGETRVGAVITLIAWGAAGFGVSPILQHQAGRAASHSPDIVNSLNISAFNFGIAAGALIGGRVVAGPGVHAVMWIGGLIVAAAAILAAMSTRGMHRGRTTSLTIDVASP